MIHIPIQTEWKVLHLIRIEVRVTDLNYGNHLGNLLRDWRSSITANNFWRCGILMVGGV